jgi:SAM-dependent methyltransferase
MGIKDEIQAYEKAEVSIDTGEIELWDHVIFPNVIRKRELGLIFSVLERARPRKILDFGCGAGWLSKILLAKGYDVIGIDASDALINSAVKSCQEGRFIVGDCMNMPFADGVFDCVIGSAILHHLETARALAECRRVTSPGGVLMLMEPNKLNPIAALARKVIHLNTKDENPFYPGRLKKALAAARWDRLQFRYLFPYSFSLSYLFKILRLGDRQGLKVICPLIEATERILEKAPLLNQLSYQIFTVARKGRGLEGRGNGRPRSR